ENGKWRIEMSVVFSPSGDCGLPAAMPDASVRTAQVVCHEQIKNSAISRLSFYALKIFECPFDAFGPEKWPHLLRAFDALMTLSGPLENLLWPAMSK
ncbi:MAG: hypothetical protein JSV70_03040, partial [bacterium]